MKKRLVFPSTLSIALALSAFVFLSAMVLEFRSGKGILESTDKLVLAWYQGLWDNTPGGLYFAFQIIFILVLGHVLALTRPFEILIDFITNYCTNSANTAVIISLSSILLAYLNWGLALVLGALMVRQVLQRFNQMNKPLNIGLIGASAYVSMLVWHGGLSGSSPIKAMEPMALREMMKNAGYPSSNEIPELVGASETLFSAMNLTVFFALLVLIPLTLYFLAKKLKHKEQVPQVESRPSRKDVFVFKLNTAFFTGSLFLVIAFLVARFQLINSSAGFLNVNFINLSLLGLAILFHNNFERFTDAVKLAIGDASGILIQFPLYFGIIGLMKVSGLSNLLSEALIDTATAQSFSILSFLSAGLLNFFIPSGGGQFYIQGPILIQSAIEYGVSIPKTIMALSYGDQWTNMLQPFWALPLLGITKIRLSDIFPYCLALFAVSGIVFFAALLLF